MTRGDIEIGIDVTNAGAVKGFKQVGDAAQEAADKAAKSSQRTQKVINGGAKIAAAGFLAAGAGAVLLAKGAAEDQKAAQALATQLKNTTGATNAQVAATEAWISKQGQLTGITDDTLRPALAKLATATGDVGEAQKLALLAQNVSIGTGKSYTSIVDSLVRAQNGSVGGLSRLGIATKDAAGKTKDFATIQGELADKFKGQASKQAETLGGKMEILRTQLSEAGESIGYALIPALTWLANFAVNNVLPALTAVGNWMVKHKPIAIALGSAIATIGAAFIVASLALKAYQASALVVSVVTKTWAAAQWLLNAAMNANPIGLIVLAIAGLAAAFIIAYKKSETFRNIVNGAFGAVKSVAQSVAGFFTKQIPAAFDRVKSAASSVLGWVKSNWPKVLAVLTGPIGVAVLLIVSNFGRIKEAASKAVAWVKTKFGDMVGYFRSLPGKLKGIFSGLWDGLAGGLKSAINSVLHLPLTIPKINTHIPGVGTVGGQTLIPALAKGGVVTGPTLAMVGERGSEMVVPLTGPGGPMGIFRSMLAEMEQVNAELAGVRVALGGVQSAVTASASETGDVLGGVLNGAARSGRRRQRP